MPQIITPSNAQNNVQMATGATQGLQVGPIPIQWLGNQNQATIDLTAVVKTSNISIKSMLVDNSNCILTVLVTDPSGNITSVPPGSFGYFPVSWFPGGQFNLSVANVLSGSPTIISENSNVSAPTITNISFLNWRVEPLIGKGQSIKYQMTSNTGYKYSFVDNKSTISGKVALLTGGNTMVLVADNWGSTSPAPIKMSNFGISIQVTTQPTQAMSGTLNLGTNDGANSVLFGFQGLPGQYNIPINIPPEFFLSSYATSTSWLNGSIQNLNPGAESLAGNLLFTVNFEMLI